ncbi:hypothetical protein ABE571_04480 [Stenotrophomonas sp. TWI273]|uniref:Pepco domain-containing protein n=1 Tax=Stenotrophomonas sp. TWI273 TaxID=3136774 RepID=UPI00320AF831
MIDPAHDDFEISILVPGQAVATHTPDPSVVHHSVPGWVPSFRRVAKVGTGQLQEQWTRTIDKLMQLSSAAAACSKDWSVDEIEVGLTMSAKGELLFIAEAGAEASITFKLTRKNQPTSDVLVPTSPPSGTS